MKILEYRIVRSGAASVLALCAASIAATAIASVDLSILPAATIAQPGDTVTVDLTIVGEGDAFNGYDARVHYDKQRLVFLQLSPIGLQEGSLMTDACPNRFHIFTIAPDSAYVTINHVLLCAGVTVTGPGVVYRLEFICQDILGGTPLTLDPDVTHFYDDGFYVEPVNLTDATIQIGGSTATPDRVGVVPSLEAAPNPFNPQTTLTFALPRADYATLEVFDLAGRLVRHLAADDFSAGRYAITWDGRDDAGHGVATGTYMAALVANGHREVCKVVVIK